MQPRGALVGGGPGGAARGGSSLGGALDAGVAGSSAPGWWRLGQVIEYRAGNLLAIQFPAEAADKTETKAFCAELLDTVRRLDAQSITAFSTCLDLSTRSGEFTDVSRDCEDSLHSLDPRGYPSLAEVISPGSWGARNNGGPAHPATRMQVFGVQQDPTPFIPADANDL